MAWGAVLGGACVLLLPMERTMARNVLDSRGELTAHSTSLLLSGENRMICAFLDFSEGLCSSLSFLVMFGCSDGLRRVTRCDCWSVIYPPLQNSLFSQAQGRPRGARKEPGNPPNTAATPNRGLLSPGGEGPYAYPDLLLVVWLLQLVVG